MSSIEDFIIDDEIQQQQHRDIAKRSFTGAFIYLIIWAAITIPNQLYAKETDAWWSFTLLMTLLAFIRTGMIVKFDKIYGNSPILWQCSFFVIVWLSALIWGLLCAVSLTTPAFSTITFVMITATAGLTSGGAASVAPNRILTLGMISAFLVPSILALLFIPNNHNISLWLLFCIYWVGMFSVTKIQHKEYWLSIKHSFITKRYAAELEKLNTIDGLTGLKNRVFFDGYLRTELKKSSRLQFPVALLLIDIDHFKSINDRFGHLAGDECLRQVSKILRKMVVRDTDIVARFGGEEFAIILPGSGPDQAMFFAERTRKAVEAMNIVTQERTLSLTVSIGVAEITATSDTKNEEIIAIADAALYAAKKGGRNRVIMG